MNMYTVDLLCKKCHQKIGVAQGRENKPKYRWQICDDCKIKTYEVDLLCRRCKTKLGTVRKKKNKPVLRWKLCSDCKKEGLRKRGEKHVLSDNGRKSISDRMKINNPMFNKETSRRVSQKNKQLWEEGKIHRKPYDKNNRKKHVLSDNGRKSISDRMKINNPMFNKETSKKMSDTRQRNVETGKTVYKKGSQHHLWKGGCRNFNNSCRSHLYHKWTEKIFIRDGYKCTMCGGKSKNGYLQAHHIKKLSEFIKEIKNKYGIKSFENVPREEWQKYIDEIVANHKLSDGITVCKECHEKIDHHYHRDRKNNRWDIRKVENNEDKKNIQRDMFGYSL